MLNLKPHRQMANHPEKLGRWLRTGPCLQCMKGAGCHEHVTNGGPSDDILTRFPTPWKIPCLEKIAWFSHGLPWFPRIFLAKFSRVSTPSDPPRFGGPKSDLIKDFSGSIEGLNIQRRVDHGYLHFNTIHSTDGTCTWKDIRLSTVKNLRWTHNQWLLILAIAQSNSCKKSCLRSCKKTFCGSTMLELTKNRINKNVQTLSKRKRTQTKASHFFEITHLETTHKKQQG